MRDRNYFKDTNVFKRESIHLKILKPNFFGFVIFGKQPEITSGPKNA